MADSKAQDANQPIFNGCFGCGGDNPISMKLVFEAEGDSNVVVARTRLSSHYAGYREFAHGGVVATLLDEAMGWALLESTGNYGVTRNLNVTYRRPVSLDRTILVRGEIVARDGRSVRLKASVADERGRVLASAEGDWSMVRQERAAAAPSEK